MIDFAPEFRPERSRRGSGLENDQDLKLLLLTTKMLFRKKVLTIEGIRNTIFKILGYLRKDKSGNHSKIEALHALAMSLPASGKLENASVLDEIDKILF